MALHIVNLVHTYNVSALGWSSLEIRAQTICQVRENELKILKTEDRKRLSC